MKNNTPIPNYITIDTFIAKIDQTDRSTILVNRYQYASSAR